MADVGRKGDSDMMELGNLVFGNSRGVYPVPRWWRGLLLPLIITLWPDNEGEVVDEFENDVFWIMPYVITMNDVRQSCNGMHRSLDTLVTNRIVVSCVTISIISLRVLAYSGTSIRYGMHT